MSAEPDLILGPDAVDLWWIALDQVPADALTALSGDEMVRAERFKYELHRCRWLAARAGLRQVLARYLGIAPAAVRFHHGPGGKPELGAWTLTPTLAPSQASLSGGRSLPSSRERGLARDQPRSMRESSSACCKRDQIRFNLAHAAARALIAVAREREVGVDLEWIDPNLDVPALLSVACTPAEAARLAAVPEDRRVVDFLTLWTLKEAYLKATGQGLSREPRAIEIDRDAGGHIIIRDPEWNDPRASWRHQSLTNHDGWIGALAVAGSRVVVTERAFTVEAR
ncbi:MAG: 4'-phosphopantetheinyl transferase superfamily protein [Thermomicrobiales bacterium]